jgi:hypothetical protein
MSRAKAPVFKGISPDTMLLFGVGAGAIMLLIASRSKAQAQEQEPAKKLQVMPSSPPEVYVTSPSPGLQYLHHGWAADVPVQTGAEQIYTTMPVKTGWTGIKLF